ncbi:hypothetical protein GC209_11520 [bacterium]|nr:hypothetical protein [bacterium]
MANYGGGAGNDTLTGGNKSDVITGAGGNDVLSGMGGNDTIYGGDGNDTLDGGIGNDSLLGEAGDDTFKLTDSFGRDTIVGGETSEVHGDTVDASSLSAAVTVNLTGSEAGSLSDGTSTASFSQIENFVLTGQSDSFNAANATLAVNVDGGAGNDTLVGSTAADTLMGGTGDDSIASGAGNDLVYGGDGNDRISTGGGINTVYGGAGNDVISAGNDTLASHGSALYGDAGADTISGANTNDTIDGGSGADSLMGNGGNDVIYGGQGAAIGTTYITNGTFSAGGAGWSGTDLETNYTEGAYLGNGSTNNVAEMDGNSGATTVMQQSFVVEGAQTAQLTLRSVVRTQATVGVDGFKAEIVDSSGNVISSTTILPTSNTTWANYTVNFTFPAAGTYSLRLTEVGNDDSLGAIVDDIQITSTSVGADVSADTLYGGDGDDTLYGMGGHDVLSGDAGNDLLYGGDGNDTVSGGDGNDTLYGDASNDSLSGNAGNDQIYGGTGDDTLSGGSGDDTLSGDAGNDLAYGGDGNDVLSGGDGNDTLYGDAGDDTLGGDAGNDALYGGAGADSLDGGTGNDLLDGGSEADTLIGGSGDDTLYGGDGNDALYGGDGNDVLYGGNGTNILSGGAGDDTIHGNANDEYFAAEAGNDVLYGGDGNDTFQGGIGDTVDGGAGFHDTLDLSAWGWAHTNVLYDANPQNGTVQFLDAGGHVVGSMAFSNIEKVIPCFTLGTLIATARGPVPVEDLRPGDLVETLDHGAQPLRWIGRREVSLADLIVQPSLRPIRIGAGALGQGLPCRALMVSAQHRMLIEAGRAEMLFGEAQVLVAARHLTGLADVAQVFPAGVTYLHLLFDAHEIVAAEGAWSESFQPASRTLADMDADQRAEIDALFPDLSRQVEGFAAARPTLKAHEVRVLLTA